MTDKNFKYALIILLSLVCIVIWVLALTPSKWVEMTNDEIIEAANYCTDAGYGVVQTKHRTMTVAIKCNPLETK